jgi:hypothetical protein
MRCAQVLKVSKVQMVQSFVFSKPSAKVLLFFELTKKNEKKM